MSSELPRAFWSSRVLVVLNVMAVATSLTCCTGAVMPFLFGGGGAFFLTIFGGQLLWVMLSRLEATFLGTRWAWLACVPIGYLNCAMTIFMMTGRKDALSERIVMSLVMSVPAAIVWVPALLVGLALYGVPMELSRGWSKSGLAWRDRGEALVGAVSAGLAPRPGRVGYVGYVDGRPPDWRHRGLRHRGRRRGRPARGAACASATRVLAERCGRGRARLQGGDWRDGHQTVPRPRRR